MTGRFTVKVDAVVRVCEFMVEHGTPPDIQVGHSWSGAAVIAAAMRTPGVRVQRLLSRQGDTAWGDTYMVNVPVDGDAAGRLRQIVESRHTWHTDRSGRAMESNLALERVLHHKELHSQQWAARGHARMIHSLSLGSAARQSVW